MRYAVLVVVLLALTGCGTVAGTGVTSSTPVDFLHELKDSKVSQCFSLTATGFGSISGAMIGAEPDVEINQTGASCTIKRTAPAGAK